MHVSSRFLVGLGAWLLGTVTATTGSMIAVNELAHGLLNAQAQQLGGTAVNANFDHVADRNHSAPVVTLSPKARASTPAPRVAHSATPSAAPSAVVSAAPGANTSASASPPPSSAGTLLVSADGSVMATCESAGAYLLYWIPDQGFQADDVVRGPAAVASVVFQNTTSRIVMRVSCSGGRPIASVWHDE